MPKLITAKTLTKAFADSNAMAEAKRPKRTAKSKPPTDKPMAEPKPPKDKKTARPTRYDVFDSRIAGLQLRVKPSGVRWSMRARLHGDQRRYDLGPAVAGDEDVGGLSIDSARFRAGRVAELARDGINPEHFLTAANAGVSIETARRIKAERPKPSWTWEMAKKNFLADVERTNREDTHRDYKGKLQPAELSRFDGRRVNTITVIEMAAAIAEVHGRGAETMSEGMVRTIKRMFNWLAESVRQDETNVADGVMTKLKAPKRTRVEVGEPKRRVEAGADPNGEDASDPEDEAGDAPPEIEIGRALALAKLGCLPERIGLGIQLLIGTVQRRRTVTGGRRWDFQNFKEANSEVLWRIRPYFRKSGTKRGSRPHLVPVVGFAAQAQERLDRLSDYEGSEGWLFPAGLATKSGRPHAESGLFNDWLAAMPGISFSPHGARYAFATYGERDLCFVRGEGKKILDHLEGIEPDDVTGQFYSSDPGMGRKRAMMHAWTDWCDEWMAKAIKQDPALENRDLMYREIRAKRYAHKKKTKAPADDAEA